MDNLVNNSSFKFNSNSPPITREQKILNDLLLPNSSLTKSRAFQYYEKLTSDP